VWIHKRLRLRLVKTTAQKMRWGENCVVRSGGQGATRKNIDANIYRSGTPARESDSKRAGIYSRKCKGHKGLSLLVRGHPCPPIPVGELHWKARAQEPRKGRIAGLGRSITHLMPMRSWPSVPSSGWDWPKAWLLESLQTHGEGAIVGEFMPRPAPI
jgi:hypothetical protein